MEILLEHPFLWRCHNIDQLLENTSKLSSFCNKLEKQSLVYPDRFNPDKYKGDGFELFVEALVKLSSIDNRIGIGNYCPVISDDTGVDGYGIGIDLKPATIQIKYRSNKSELLTANKDHLSNFTSTSLFKYKVDPNTKTNLLIITTAKGLHHYTEDKMFENKVRCIGYDQLRELVDNNLLFWDKFKQLIIYSKNKK